MDLDSLAALVLDEADRLLEQGFAQEVAELVRLCPARRQTLLFSATLSPEVERLAALSLQAPARLSADGVGDAPASLREEVVKIRPAQEAEKEAVVLSLLGRAFSRRAIVFCATKQGAHRLKVLAGLVGLAAAELHGDLTQAQRLAALETFRTGAAAVLIATDVAARGLDIPGVDAVLSMDAPSTLASYMHRVGRTARAGAAGCCVTLMEEKDRALLRAVAKRGRGRVSERRVDRAEVASWLRRIEGLEDALQRVAALEREERMGRKAEMEAQKAENLLEHADDIAARPARTWFETDTQKKARAKASHAQEQGQPTPGGAAGKRKGGGAADGGSAKKPRKVEPPGGRGSRAAAPEEDAEAAREAFSAKRGAALAKAAAKRAMAGGLRPAQVKAAVQKAAKGAPRKKTAPREGEGDPGNTAATSRQRSGPPLTGLFAGDGINGSRPNAGAGLDDGGGFGRVAGRTSPGGFGGGRGGAKEKKPDAKSGKFKSKSRYKRR